MALNFNPIDANTAEAYNRIWDRSLEFSSDMSFMILWGWSEAYGYQMAFDEDLVWIRQTVPDERYLAPAGDWRNRDWNRLLRDKVGNEAQFMLVPEALVRIWQEDLGDQVEVTEDRDAFEYLYMVKDLATLAGNKYMRKRNRVNQFVKTYEYSYVPISSENVPRVLEFQKVWCKEQGCALTPILKQENDVIHRVLSNWDNMPNIMGAYIEVYGKIIAYTVAEAVMPEKTVMIHFEKGLHEYHQAYQVINRDFLAHHVDDFTMVNREEDLGDEGLREAKLAYLPVDFLKKYNVSWKARD